jgi:hypothetical protein
MKLTTPTKTLSNLSKRECERLAVIVQKDPVMLAKINSLASGIAADRRKRNTPSRRVIEALTHEQLAEKAKTTPTTLSRFLSKHGIYGDVRVGSRYAYSKALAEKISAAVFWAGFALTATHCGHVMRDSSPKEADESHALAATYRAECDRILASIPKFKI